MKQKIFSGFAAFAIVFVLTSPAGADLAPYSQDFEGLNQQDPGALSGDGWLIFGNTFDPNFNYIFGYGVFGAPNGGPGFSGIDIGQGGPEQGDQQLVIYNDYNNYVHPLGGFVEANVFQEQFITAADVGSTWRFSYDAKAGNIDAGSTATAFFKTLNPAAGFSLSNFITVDMTNTPSAWTRYSIDIDIDPSLEGQILQFGFLTVATLYEPSGIFYDNINFDVAPLAVNFDIRPESCPNPLNTWARGVLPTAVMGTFDLDVADIDVSSLRLSGVAPILSSYVDVANPYNGATCGCAATSPDGLTDLTLKFRIEDLIPTIGSTMAGSHTLMLTGTLLDGTPIEGQDCIFFVGRGGRDNRVTSHGIESRKTRTPSFGAVTISDW